MPAAAKQPRSTWWIIPLVIVGLVLIAWLLLAGLPFGRDEARAVAEGPETETIAEGTAPPPQPTGTIVDVDTAVEPPPALTESGVTMTQPPPTATQPPPTATQPPPVIVDERPTPAPRPDPTPPVRNPTPPARNPAPPAGDPAPPARDREPSTPAPAPSGEISESEATSVLRGFITSQSYYEGVRPECIQIRGSGYRNVGYGFSVWDSCASGGGSRMLGRWRVDSKTREVFRQAGDGRYVRP